jgi:ribosomal protein L17
MKAIVAKLVTEAKAGNVTAAREVIDRTLGKPQEADLIERITQLETLLKKEIP